MVKKFIILLLLGSLLVGCDGKINNNSSYKDVANLAYHTKISSNNKNGLGYTFFAPSNSTIKETSNFSTTLKVSNCNYSIYVNSLQYVEDKGLVVETANGDYVLNDKKTSKVNDKFNYEYRRIFLADDNNLTVEENEENAKKVFAKIKNEGNIANKFSEYAINYSSDTATSSNGGYVGPVSSNEIDYKTLQVLQKLNPKEYNKELIALENGYEIVLLEKKYLNDEMIEENITDNNGLVTSNDGFSTYVIDKNNSIYSIITKNDYISVSTNVSKKNVSKGIYNTIITARSIKINSDIIVNFATNPIAFANSSELFELNKSNEAVVKQLSNSTDLKFNNSLSEVSTEKTNTFKFDVRKATKKDLKKKH
ncbi:MAG: peptidylprolyl isomerase [Bacilli bacterium]